MISVDGNAGVQHIIWGQLEGFVKDQSVVSESFDALESLATHDEISIQHLQQTVRGEMEFRDSILNLSKNLVNLLKNLCRNST